MIHKQTHRGGKHSQISFALPGAQVITSLDDEFCETELERRGRGLASESLWIFKKVVMT